MSGQERDDRFYRFGIQGFTTTTRVNAFVDHLEEGRVMGTRCPRCGRCFFPPRAECARCLTGELDWFEVCGTGRLLTFSTLSYAPVGFDEQVPYTIALLDYGEYRVFGRIAADLSPEELAVGMEMRTAARALPGGRLAYEFERAPTS
ncbi:MAG: Zn-ribbon domain-containing OB-fold protein [Deltaproteobacteria bacterium]|nr:Zn-ribbon domain-containing OB-fold protein [Deltaproteobacteria bacterium]